MLIANISSRALVRTAAVSLLVLVMAVAFAQSAHAKGNLKATLDRPLPADAKPGSILNVNWKLTNELVGRTEPFGAGEIFIRLVGPDYGQATEEVVEGVGSFSADIAVPAGGISRVEIGIKSAFIGRRGNSLDHVIPIAGQVLTSPPPASDGWPSAPVLIVGGLVLLTGLAFGARYTRARRRIGAEGDAVPVAG